MGVGQLASLSLWAARARRGQPSPPSRGELEVACALLAYCCTSGGMLIVNKLAVQHVPLPALLTLCQFSSASLFVFGGKLLGLLEMDDFEWPRAKYFLIYVAFFTIGTYSNVKVLSVSNVETIVVFRSCTPLAISIFDYLFYQRELPSSRSCASLFLIVTGAAGYMLTDREFQLHGVKAYFWAGIWWVVTVIQLTLGKFLVGSLDNKTLWTPVLYTNTFSVLPALLIGCIAGEISERRLLAVSLDFLALFWVLLSCAIGVGISWAGFWCQSVVSATTYSVVGVMNKMITVSVNVCIWSNHASAHGIAALCVCLLGGSLYQQAPLRLDCEALELDPEITALKASRGDGEKRSSEFDSLREASPK